MRAPTFQSLLLTLVLLFGQWLSFAHDSTHPLFSGGDDQSCEFCVHAQGVGAGLAELPAAVPASFEHEVPVAEAVTAVTPEAPSHYPIRGPPSRLA